MKVQNERLIVLNVAEKVGLCKSLGNLIKRVIMAKKHMGEVKNPTGSSYDYYWDEDTGEVYVGPSSAGKASSAEEAWRKANFYVTTLQKWKD
jgi:hypothetical protein